MNKPGKQRIIRAAWTFSLLAALSILVLSLPGYIQSKAIFATPYSLPESFRQLGTIIWWLRNILSLFAAMLSIVLAVLIYKRKPADGMAVFLSFYLLFYAVIMAGPMEILFEYWLPGEPDLGTRVQSLVFSLPSMVLLLIFPNGKFQPRWTRHLVWLGLLLTVLASFLAGDQLMLPTTLPAQIVIGLLYFLFLLSPGVQIYRYFAVYTYQERQQAKWVFFGLLAWIATMAISSIPYYFLLYAPSGQPVPTWAILLSPIWFLSLSIMPVSISFAILHSRLWEIDVIIRRTLLYSLLTGILGLLYFSGVALFQSVLTTSGQPSTWVIVVTTLAIAALVNPLRRRLQDLIDRRFYRQKYDSEKALADFASVARSETNLGPLVERLLNVVQETLSPETVIFMSSFVDKYNLPQSAKGKNE